MKRIQRRTLGTEADSHDVRIEQLERRIFLRGLRWCRGTTDGAGNQTVTATDELIWGDSFTNAPELFAWDPTDPAGILIKRDGMFACFATVNVVGASIGVARAMYQAVCQLSQGPGFCVGNQLGEGEFFLGTGQGSPSIAAVTTIAKSTLSSIAVTGIRANVFGPDDPARHAVFLEHSGGNYTVGGILSSAWIIELSSDEYDNTPPP